MKTKYIKYQIVAYIQVPVNKVTWLSPDGSNSDPEVIENLSCEDIKENIDNGDLDFDALKLAEDCFEIDKIEVLEE